MKIPVKSIVNALKNYVFKDPLIEIKANTRANICNNCTYLKGSFCTKCGCIIMFKIRSETERCPLKLW